MGRIIFLVDMNAFFISCEMARNTSLKGRPAAVAGDPKNRSGIVLTANYEARKYNVKTTMLVHEARELCPDIVFVPPDHQYYEIMSGKVMEILQRYTPVIQKNSIDEAWMDLTGCELLFGRPIEIAQRIMNDIREELDLWCSIGISDNKFLSKMASEIKKPLGITEIWQKDIRQKIWPLPVRDMYGVGRQTQNKLSKLAIYTIGDIAKCDRRLLVKIFGKYGDEIYQLANGIDPSPVTANPEHDSRSISRSTTLSKDITDLEYAKQILADLSEDVGVEARRTGCKGKTVSITIKYKSFDSITRQKSILPTYLTRDIYSTGAALLEQNWDNNKAVRLLGISLANIVESYGEQITMFDLCNCRESEKREESLERAMDSIRQKFGYGTVKRGSTIGNEKIEK